jgi:hypothetical protein
VVSWAGPGARGTVRNVPGRRGTRRRRRRRCAWTAWWRRVPAEGGETGAAVAVATGVVLLPLRSELAVWRGGMEQGDAGGEGYKKGKPGASAAAAAAAARRGAVLRSCACACAAHAHVGTDGEWRAGWRYCCAVCGLRGLLAAGCRVPTTGIDCVLPPL